MKFASVLTALTVLTSAVASHALAADTTYKILPAESQVTWVGKKVTGQHTGSIAVKSGQLVADGQTLKSGQVSIDMNTVTDKDLTDAEFNKKLTTHLKSDDFFNAAKFPTSDFVLTSATFVPAKGVLAAGYTVTGKITIKGVTQEMTFPATVTFNGNRIEAKAMITIDRTKFGLKYGSGKFFTGLGDHLIYDNFDVTLDLIGTM